MAQELEVFPEDWSRALAIVAHPDDMEYGSASAVARWTAQGKDIAYLLVTAGEAGIQSMAPDKVGPIRMEEQRRSCAVVGVDKVEFLDHVDGLVVEGLGLRRDLARSIRQHRPEVVLSINYRDSFDGGCPNARVGAASWNHSDHRAVGRALIDAVRDAANPWVFTDCGEPWGGVQFAAFGASPYPSHAVDITDHIDSGIESLKCHQMYLDNLDDPMSDADGFLRRAAAETGPSIGVELATSFEMVNA